MRLCSLVFTPALRWTTNGNARVLVKVRGLFIGSNALVCAAQVAAQPHLCPDTGAMQEVETFAVMHRRCNRRLMSYLE
jgi:hypothetical protein